MASKTYQITKDIREALKLGMTKNEVAQLTGATMRQIDAAVYNERARVRKRNKEASRRHYLRTKLANQTISAEEAMELGSLERNARPRRTEPLLTEPEVKALQDIHAPATHIDRIEAPKYTLWERIRILFRGF